MIPVKTEYLPYYLSRAVLSGLIAVILTGFSWTAALVGVTLWGLFLLYLHSGWFEVDLSNPYFPLRRDQRGREVQRKALIAAVLLALVGYLLTKYLPGSIGIDLPGNLALPLAVLAYFIAQFILLAKG